MQFFKFFVICIAIVSRYAEGSKNPNFAPGRSVIVHLFEWKWSDIALECERFLGPKGYAGVQVSPVTENLIIRERPWFERYQPISYILVTRSGNETEFADMVRRCNAVGVRTYVDVVINHMTGIYDVNIGTDGSWANPSDRFYPAVPFNNTHFNSPPCPIQDYCDAHQVRNCELVGLRDLNHSIPYVKEKTIDFLNGLIDHGVAGFRVDAAKHIWPQNLKDMYESLKPLNTAHGFEDGARAYIAQEVIDLGGEGIKNSEYTPLGAITEFRFSNEIGRVFRKKVAMHWLRSWGTEWTFVKSEDALVFVDNHDNQRGHGAGGEMVLSYRDGKSYRMATAWALAHPYGNVRIMSSFEFPLGANDQGPPHDEYDNILSPIINVNGSCGNGWVCEHRWNTTANMVSFRIAAGDAPIDMWYDNKNNHVALSRGNRAFIAFNHEATDFKEALNTTLPAGIYCDIISGQRADNSCTGSSVAVNQQGMADIYLPADSTEGVIAIHVGPLSKLT